MPCGRRIGPKIRRTPSRPHLEAPLTTATLQKTPAVDTAPAPILKIEDLVVEFRQQEKVVRAANHVSIAIRRGETMGIVGESGSGKSVLCRQYSSPAAIASCFCSCGPHYFQWSRPTEAIRWRDGASSRHRYRNDLSKSDERPQPSLAHWGPDQRGRARPPEHQFTRRSGSGDCPIEARRHTKPRTRVDEYPHQWSGGMLQRAVIAMAIAGGP